MRLTYLGTASYFYDAVVLKLTEGRSVMEYARAGQGLCLALMGDHDPQVTSYSQSKVVPASVPETGRNCSVSTSECVRDYRECVLRL